MTERQYAVAIDGPSGAGKSTLARAAAEALHILYVDTGAIYRTIGVYMYRHDIAPTDAPAVIAGRCRRSLWPCGMTRRVCSGCISTART